MLTVYTDEELTGSPKPIQKGVTRGELIIGGWILEPVDGGRRTRATFMLEMDLKGIPQWAIKQANKEQGYQIKDLRKIIS